MATRQRNRPTQSDSHESEEDLLSYETMFGLDDDISEADVEDFLAEQEVEAELKDKKEGFLNLQTGSGLAIIAIGTIYLLQQLGFFGLPFSMGAFVALLPWLAGILIVLTGFGVLSWSPSRRRRKARQKARERRARMERQRKTMGRSTKTDERTKRSKAYEEAKKSARQAAREASRVASRAKAQASQRSGRKRKRLAKSRKSKVIAGVAGGIANYLGIEPVLVRIAFVIGTVMGSGFTIPLYLILSFVLPAAEAWDEDDDDDKFIQVVRD